MKSKYKKIFYGRYENFTPATKILRLLYDNFTAGTKILRSLPKFVARSATFGPAALKAVTLGPFLRFKKRENRVCVTKIVYCVAKAQSGPFQTECGVCITSRRRVRFANMFRKLYCEVFFCSIGKESHIRTSF